MQEKHGSEHPEVAETHVACLHCQRGTLRWRIQPHAAIILAIVFAIKFAGNAGPNLSCVSDQLGIEFSGDQ